LPQYYFSATGGAISSLGLLSIVKASIWLQISFTSLFVLVIVGAGAVGIRMVVGNWPSAALTLSIEPQSVTIVDAKSGEKYSTNLVVRNGYSETVVVRDFQSSCSCISASISPMVILPGEAASLTIVITRRSLGLFRGAIRIGIQTSNDQQVYQVTVPVEISVVDI
jgi:hypothetical protein